jgi:hypothetical protein
MARALQRHRAKEVERMTGRNLARSPNRPLRTTLVCSVAALAVALGGGAASADDRDHRDRGDRHGDRRGYDDHHKGEDHHYDKGKSGRYGKDHGRYGRYESRGYHRDPGHRYGNDYRYRGYSDDHHYRYGSSYRGDYYDRGYDRHRFVAPRHLYRQHYRDYDRYYRGSVFYAPHRHSHRVYLFPVIIDGYAEYRPYAYCGDAYYPDHYGYYDGPRFGLHFSF